MIDIGNWLRQARYRAKKNNVTSTLTKPEIVQVLNNFGHKCAYCDDDATSLDNLIPFSHNAPNIQANILPICAACKVKKHNRTICWMHDNQYISTERYINIVQSLIHHVGYEEMKLAMRNVLGLK